MPIPINSRKHFPDWLYYLRCDLDISRNTLARKLDVTAQTIDNWERGYYMPTMSSREDVMIRLAALDFERAQYAATRQD